MRKMSDFVNFPGRPGTALGTLGEPKNSLKIDFLLKNGVPNVLFRRFLCTKLVSALFARFSVDFSRKIDEKSMKKTMRFFASSLVFFNMATLTKHCILQYESYFFIFRVFVIFTKKHGKNNAKMLEAGFVAKITTEWSPGRYFGSKNAPEFTSETTKIAKIDQKSSFLARQFFTRFFRRKKCNFSPI